MSRCWRSILLAQQHAAGGDPMACVSPSMCHQCQSITVLQLQAEARDSLQCRHAGYIYELRCCSMHAVQQAVGPLCQW
jgi:hypothetical protein